MTSGRQSPLAVDRQVLNRLRRCSALSARGSSNCNREDLGKRWPTTEDQRGPRAGSIRLNVGRSTHPSPPSAEDKIRQPARNLLLRGLSRRNGSTEGLDKRGAGGVSHGEQQARAYGEESAPMETRQV
jgi:hypothetical protein